MSQAISGYWLPYYLVLRNQITDFYPEPEYDEAEAAILLSTSESKNIDGMNFKLRKMRAAILLSTSESFIKL
jgi:hypothetical protein